MGDPSRDAGGGEPHWGTRPRRVLAFLRDYTTEHGYPPSTREIGDAVGLSSVSSVVHQLQVLESRGYITRTPNTPRGITVLDAPAATDVDVDPAHLLVLAERRRREGSTSPISLTLDQQIVVLRQACGVRA